MSHTYRRTVDKCEVAIVVNEDWSGDAEVVIEDHSMTPYRVDRARCIAKQLAIGSPRDVSGRLNTVQWMMASALAADEFAAYRRRVAKDEEFQDKVERIAREVLAIEIGDIVTESMLDHIAEHIAQIVNRETM